MEDTRTGDQKANEFWPVYTQDEYNEYNSLLMTNQETSEPKVYSPTYKKELLENLRKFGYEKLANEIGVFSAMDKADWAKDIDAEIQQMNKRSLIERIKQKRNPYKETAIQQDKDSWKTTFHTDYPFVQDDQGNQQHYSKFVAAAEKALAETKSEKYISFSVFDPSKQQGLQTDINVTESLNSMVTKAKEEKVLDEKAERKSISKNYDNIGH